MISYIKGKILDISDRSVIVEANNVGYKIFVTDDTLLLTKKDSIMAFWTYLAVRENAMDLFGFPNKKDEIFFELLISISGIGPRTALGILSAVSSDTLSSAIRSGSTAHLVKVSGIGRKTAEKIVLELKDKLGTISNENYADEMLSDIDAIEALKALGYDASEAREALKKISKDITDTGDKIKAVLKFLN